MGDFMLRKTTVVVCFLLAALMSAVLPAQPVAAQNEVGGAILGGAAGAIIGGAVTGRGEGAAIGAVIGAATGAAIAHEGRRNRHGYYAWHHRCYYRRRDGAWIRVNRRYCY